MSESSEPVAPAADPEPPSQGFSMGITAVLLLMFGAAAIFGAGLSLGGQTIGRDEEERAALEAFSETYQRINSEFVGESEPGELLKGAIRGMFETLDDPYSAYMDPDEYAATFAGITGEFEGVGARMGAEDAAGLACQPIGESCVLRVTEVLAGSPALDGGLMDGDVVTAVDGQPLEGKNIDDAVLLIRGPRGSDVELTVDRDGTAQVLTITRDVIVSQDVQSAVLADGKVGYLRLDSFSSNAADDFDKQLGAHLDSGISRLVLDLRGDPGGFVDAAVDITSQFLDEGAVFWEEAADGSQRSIDVVPGGRATDPAIKLAVLVDGGSASASEILAGALQDAGRASLVGETTFGKGTVQEWTQLPGENGGFRLSVAKWLTRDKEWVHNAGLRPDVPVASSGVFYQPGADNEEADVQLAHAISVVLEGDASEATARTPTASVTPIEVMQPHRS